MGLRQGPVEGLSVQAVFWKGKRVLVTGHTGFKGSWLCLWLQRLGAQVSGYALKPPTDPSVFDLAQVGRGIQSIEADVRDLPRLKAAVSDLRPEVVIHLAAQALVRPSYQDPVGTYATNVMGTVHVLEAIRQGGHVRSAVIVTSDKCYQNNEWAWGYRENEPMGGHDPYSNSKGCAELVTSAYRRSFFCGEGGRAECGLASARAGNVIGGGDWSTDRLVPDIVRGVAAGQPVAIRNPRAVRPWQHVLEPLSGYLLLAEKLWDSPQGYSEAWNFGPADGDAVPVSQVADKLVGLWGPPAAWTSAADGRLHEASFLKLDCSKARARLGWRPRTDLDQALRWVVDWHKAHLAGRDVREVCLRQIDEFMAKGS